ncbi:MAG TPA: sigma-70 family RNA polymerase sigma factor [Edaphocola sp.]|nr:sigma-70 family RNA polymerase sigma factor [Edaphocola sp.]
MSIALIHNNILTGTSELEALISGCVRNDRSAQFRLYEIFYPRMIGMVKRYFPDQERAEEILNNGFLRAFQKIDSYGYKGSFEGWLRKIVFHAVSDYAKTELNYSKNTLFVEKEEFVHKELAANLFYDDLIKLVYELPEKQRVVFNMYVFEDLGHKEIAKNLGFSENTSKWYLSEARKILKEKVEKLGLHLKR